MRVFVAAALCVALCGCVTSGSPPPAATAASTPSKVLPPYTLTKDDVAAVEKAVRDVLKDPQSARFGRMVAGSDGGDSATVCLMVNAKNSYGGYTGDKPFMGILLTDRKPRVFVVHTDNDPNRSRYRDEATMNVCNQYGLTL